ncbi:hypothetical protein PIB30_050294 [Stylosanthes scabra]|uniref:Putative plant transposon protein domain-containing protein n=1 Tax=Stylosanthes scabra TaxID=79078 RepID=A0ABU6XI21_9FABA|nr:hypothetical protein [Stylosanthes scabra]
MVGYTLVREFYANTWVRDEEKHFLFPYTNFVRGKVINFSPEAIHKVLNLRSKPIPNVVSYHDRKQENDLRLDDVLRDFCVEGAQWVLHDDGRHHFLRRADLKAMARGWYEFVIRSIMPTGNLSEVTVEWVVLIHSIILGEDIQVDEIIAEQFYKFINKTGIRTMLPFLGVIQRLCNEANVSILDDTMIPQATERTMREIQQQGIPITMDNLKIHRLREEEMLQERQRYQRILDEAASARAKEQNKGKARRVEEDSEEDED